MASIEPIWDAEAALYKFECALGILEKISDGLPEDKTTTHALNGLHSLMSNIYAEFTAEM
ncbi:hypothetical protein [Robiginitomaculum antarcticum]|uniref:hypothetical protein n=1 Tax=Robiginitomaculum antarcticum TaxID=437507 RepID=UPI000360CFCF|nr:hypothetical protein [Robiginitomaculum antarcticum]